MKLYKYVLALLVIATCHGCIFDNPGEEWEELVREQRLRGTDAVQGLSLQVVPQRLVFAADEEIVMYLSIQNVSQKDIRVYIEMDTGILVGLQVLGVDNEFRHATPQRELIRNADNFASISHHVVLPPGYSIGRPIRLPANTFKPGRYSISASYENHFEACMAKPDFTPEEIHMLRDGVLIDDLWQGRLVSNLVEFEVRKARRR